MKIVINGDVVITLEEKKHAGGYRVIGDEGNFFGSSEKTIVFIENPQVGARPWVAYVRQDDDGKFDFSNSTRMPLDKSRITRVL
jgi:hypothetical protein